MASDGPVQGTSHVSCSHRGAHPDASERVRKKSKTKPIEGILKVYSEEEEYTVDEMPEPDHEGVQQNRLQWRIVIDGGFDREQRARIMEIFSISVHWNEEENMGDMAYHLFGNIVVTDSYDWNECSLEAMNISFWRPLTVLNGGCLPLDGLVRCLWYNPCSHVIMFLKGHRFHSSGKGHWFDSSGINCCENKSRVLIRKRLLMPASSLLPSTKEGQLNQPIERTVAGAGEADDVLFFKIHYSVMTKSFVVAVEVRFVCRDVKEKSKFGEISINGSLSVHWLQFECLDNLCDYKIMLFDSKQGPWKSVSLGECFSTLRRTLVVPCGYALVFNAAIYTDKEEFFGKTAIRVRCHEKFYVRTFGRGPLKMQITLLNYFQK